jgi:hypothetical protein
MEDRIRLSIKVSLDYIERFQELLDKYSRMFIKTDLTEYSDRSYSYVIIEFYRDVKDSTIVEVISELLNTTI